MKLWRPYTSRISCACIHHYMCTYYYPTQHGRKYRFFSRNVKMQTHIVRQCFDTTRESDFVGFQFPVCRPVLGQPTVVYDDVLITSICVAFTHQQICCFHEQFFARKIIINVRLSTNVYYNDITVQRKLFT